MEQKHTKNEISKILENWFWRKGMITEKVEDQIKRKVENIKSHDQSLPPLYFSLERDSPLDFPPLSSH